jgi:hypothetical protein
VGRVVRRNYPAAGQDLAHVVEHDDAVAKQAPPLLGVEGDGVGGVAVRAVGRGTRGLVWTRCAPLVWGLRMYLVLWRCGRDGAGSAKTVRADAGVGVTRRCPCRWNLPRPGRAPKCRGIGDRRRVRGSAELPSDQVRRVSGGRAHVRARVYAKLAVLRPLPRRAAGLPRWPARRTGGCGRPMELSWRRANEGRSEKREAHTLIIREGRWLWPRVGLHRVLYAAHVCLAELPPDAGRVPRRPRGLLISCIS